MTVMTVINRVLEIVDQQSSYIILGLAALLLIMIIVVLVQSAKIHWLTQRYDLFMRGKDCETMEDTIVEIYRKLQIMQNRDLANKDILKMMNKNMAGTIAKTGLVKYNAFNGMGGQSSFALALLTLENHGYILNAVHNRNTCYIYVKTVVNGEATETLGEEEQRALEKALGQFNAKAADNTVAAAEKAEETEA